MVFCISVGTFDIKYFIYCALIAISELYINFVIYKYDETILNDHQIFGIFCYYFGYLLNIIPTWFVNQDYLDNIPDDKKLSIKDILKFFIIYTILLLIEVIEIISNAIDSDDEQKLGYKDGYLLFLILIMFILPKFISKIVFYKHQKISFIGFILIEVIKSIVFFIKKSNFQINDFLIIILNIFFSLLLAVYYIYIGRLMKYKYISPYKCSFLVGVGFVPLIIIIYFIISFTNDFDNIFDLFKDFEDLKLSNTILLISYPLASGLLGLLLFKTINDFTLFHLNIPFIIKKFIREVTRGEENIFFLISSFSLELIMIFVFLEIIEINFCGLNENLKKNIKKRAISESSLINKDDCAQLAEKNQSIN